MIQRIAIVFVMAMATIGSSVKAFAEKDKLEGYWFNEEKTAKIQIYRAVDNKFWGKIVWLAEPNRDGKPKLDEKNSKAGMRSRPVMGLPILSHFEKKDDKTYSDGEIYDPKNGKTYSSTITYRSDKELGIRGYIGVSLIGRTTKWTRAE
jgi:uncharacterized protein (DUF2147 family)